MARGSAGGKGAARETRDAPTPSEPGTTTGVGGAGVREYATYQQLRDAMSDIMAHADTKVANVEARIERTLGELPNTTKMIFIVGGAAFTVIAFLVGTLLAVLAFGGDRFDAGMNLTGATISYSVEARKALEENTKQTQELIKQNQALMELVKRQQEAPQPKAKPQ